MASMAARTNLRLALTAMMLLLTATSAKDAIDTATACSVADIAGWSSGGDQGVSLLSLRSLTRRTLLAEESSRMTQSSELQAASESSEGLMSAIAQSTNR